VWARAGPGDRCDVDHPSVAWPGVAVISSLPSHALLSIVLLDSAGGFVPFFRNRCVSSKPSAAVDGAVETGQSRSGRPRLPLIGSTRQSAVAIATQRPRQRRAHGPIANPATALASRMNHLAERQGVMNGVAGSVVIEVHKDVLAGIGPFAYPVCPPRQVRI